MLRWARDGVGPWPVIPWLVISLIAPISQLRALASPWAVLVVLLQTAAFFALTIPAGRGESVRRPVGLAALAGQVAITIAAVAAWGEDWQTLFVLGAIIAGAGLDASAAPLAVLAVTAVATLTLGLVRDDWEVAWIIALNCFLAGIATYCVYWLFTAVHELSRTREELASAAVSRERLRFARDLHDVLGHTLSVVVVKAEAVRRIAARDPAAAAQHAGDIETIGRAALQEVRETASGYRTSSWQHEIDSARLALTAAGVDLMVSGDAAGLSPAVERTVGWVVREATTNVVRHAQATTCRIELVREGSEVQVSVADDGQGGSGAEGNGLRGLRERVTQSSGSVRITHDSNGFRLVAHLPVADEETP
ncbi:hypothetical protein VV02_17840 [Luteipulveratus mongoliensis]|uniref:Uncharacterized protein n=1 Tax=Luteipulveratus mongoliensis TaxID=571913 RepID=A0A0K1JR39_9MICO|nr:hypothetical protein VV02_17840 [Luteipulveratus mongoliensis]